MPTDETFSYFRSSRINFAWICNSRRDLSCGVSTLAKVIEADFNSRQKKMVKRVNKLLLYARKNPVQLILELIDLASLHIVGFSDASFENNVDNSTQLCFFIFLRDSFNRASKIHFKSYKSRRIIHSVLYGELFAFADIFGIAQTLAIE